MQALLEEVLQYEKEIIEIRRKIHRNPELAYHEKATAKLVANKLKYLGISVRAGVGGTGVVGLLRGRSGGKVVGLRADMDALPLIEKTRLPFASKVKGVMHACGHDTHVAMLLGAAMLLSKRKDRINGSVKFIFQPAEEQGERGGAKPMIRAGAMRNPTVDYVFGLHIASGFPSRTFALKAGAIMAGNDTFTIRIVGRGGHGAAPHETVDPIFVAAQLITSLQGVRSRMIDPLEPFVLSVGSIQSGTAFNIIPDEALIRGTMRTLDEKTRAKAVKIIGRMARSVCKTFGASCEVQIARDGYPITYNNDDVSKRVFRVLRTIEGTRTIEIKPILAAEDFSRFLQQAPGAYYFLGTTNKAKGCIYPNHSPSFKVDEDVLKYGSVSLATLALDFIQGK